PERSGLPSADRGAGAERLGLPSGVLGTPPVGRAGHCAVSGDSDAERTIKLVSVFILPSPSAIHHMILCRAHLAGYTRASWSSGFGFIKVEGTAGRLRLWKRSM